MTRSHRRDFRADSTNDSAGGARGGRERTVLDTNVLVSALLSATGLPAVLLGRWKRGELEIVVSDSLLAELERTLARPGVRASLHGEASTSVVAALRDSAVVAEDPRELGSIRSTDPDDDYLIALAYSTQSALVSGDAHLLSLAGRIPVYSPREFLELLDWSPDPPELPATG